ncbi:hypothetical protein FRC04_008822 [Tulasnella sp. 424]|nr:hypothetical protein FRC04_008822 [Tulasnella sp. 424]KAG8980049.1 hypothetical protein FRC05_007492 [Tulasnella sp. 425]
MRFATPLFVLSFIATSTFADFVSPAPPTSYHVLSGIIDITPPIQTPDSLGTRVGSTWTGGNFTDNKGNVFATVIPGAGGENGFVDSAGFFHVDARMTLKLVNESNTYAYLQHMGIGEFGGVANVGLRIETNSVKYKFLNQIFVWENLTIPGPYLLVDAFSTTKPT